MPAGFHRLPVPDCPCHLCEQARDRLIGWHYDNEYEGRNYNAFSFSGALLERIYRAIKGGSTGPYSAPLTVHDYVHSKAEIPRCSECNKPAPVREIRGKKYCRLCQEKLWRRCSLCGEYTLKNEKHKHPVPDPEYAYREKGEHSRLFLGIELECEIQRISRWSGNQHALMTRRADPYYDSDRITPGPVKALAPKLIANVTSDGSLQDGIEIRSVPATFAVHTSGAWLPVFEYAEKEKLDGLHTDTAGMHVHINSVALRPMQLYNLMKLLTRRQNRVFISRIAGRGAGQYNRMIDKVSGDALAVQHAPWCAGGADHVCNCNRPYRHRTRTDAGRYQAINLHTNKGTREIRIFRSPVPDYNRFLLNIQFVQAACEFALDRSWEQMIPARFVSWLGTERDKRFKALTAFCQEAESTAPRSNPHRSVTF